MKKTRLCILISCAFILIFLSYFFFNANGFSNKIITVDINVGKTKTACEFKVLTKPSGGMPGTVQVGSGNSKFPAIAITTTGQISIPESITDLSGTYKVTEISDYAFYNCSGLTKALIIPDNVTHIGKYAFKGCTGLDGSLYIPHNTTYIRPGAFDGLINIKDVYIYFDDEIKYIGNNSFANIDYKKISLIAKDIPGKYFSRWKNIFFDFENASTKSALLTSLPNNCLIAASYITPAGVGDIITVDIEVDGVQTPCTFKVLTQPSRDNPGTLQLGSGEFETPAIAKNTVGQLNITEGLVSNITKFRYNVTEIGDYAFYDCDGLTGNLVVNENVTHIGDYAFSNLDNVTNIFLTFNEKQYIERKYIGKNAFQNTDISKVYLSILDSAYDTFSYWSTVDASFTSFTSPTRTPTHDTFSDWSTGDVPFASLASPYRLSTTFRIPPSDISVIANFSNSLNSGYIFEGLITVGDNKSVPCSYKVISHPTRDGKNGTVEILSVAKNATGQVVLPTTSVYDPAGNSYTVTQIGPYAFANCTELSGDLVIPSNINIIREYAFSECRKITGSLTLSPNLSYIGDNAFEYAGFTGTLALPDSLKYICTRAFRGCTGFTGDLTLPDSLISLDEFAFEDCTRFDGKLTLPNRLYYIEPGVFKGAVNLTGDIIIPTYVENISSDAFAGLTNISTITINFNDNGKHISNDAFRHIDSDKIFINAVLVQDKFFDKWVSDNYVPIDFAQETAPKTTFTVPETAYFINAKYSNPRIFVKPPDADALESSNDYKKFIYWQRVLSTLKNAENGTPVETSSRGLDLPVEVMEYLLNCDKSITLTLEYNGIRFDIDSEKAVKPEPTRSHYTLEELYKHYRE